MDKGSDGKQNDPKRVETIHLGQWYAFFFVPLYFSITNY